MHCSPSIRSFEVQDGQECSPPGVLNGLRQMVILRHVPDLQVLVIDHIIGAHERQCRLMMEVRPLAAHRLMRLCQEGDRFPTTVAALFAARDARSLPCDDTLL